MTDESHIVKPATLKAVGFLKDYCAATSTYPVLTALHIDPDTGVKGKIESQAFKFNAQAEIDWRAVYAWVDARQGKANVYFSVNPRVPDAETKIKAKMREVSRVVACHVDVDVRVGEDQGEGIARIVKSFEAYKLPPTFITSSGGGAQAFWVLSEPVLVGGSTDEEREAAARQIAGFNKVFQRDLDGDHCFNLDRIMRLPGTINVPDTVKRAKGRVPRLAEVLVADTLRKYDPAKLDRIADDTPTSPDDPAPKGEGQGTPQPKGRVVKAVDPHRAPSTEPKVESMDDPRIATLDLRGRIIMETGKPPESDTDKEGKDLSRSGVLFDFVCTCMRANFSSKLTAVIITDPRWPISACVLDKPNVNREVSRVISRAREQSEDPKLLELNDANHVVNMHGKTMILSYDTEDPQFPGVPIPYYWTPDEWKKFHNKWSYQYVTMKNGKETVVSTPLGDWWWMHSGRRQYNGVVYMPEVNEDTVGDKLNLWRGFAVVPVKGTHHEQFLEHLRENICAGDEKTYQYLLRWMAQRVQNPGKPAEVSIVQVGARGTGKTIWVELFGAVFGHHFITVVQHDHLTGKFNSHLQDCSLLHADECLNARDRKDEQVLKALITGRTIRIEPKGINAFECLNKMGLIMSTNNPHAVPAGEHERRFLCVNVAANRMQDHAWFGAMVHAMRKEGGIANLLHMLLSMDLSDFNIREVPHTKELDKQKAMTRRGLDALVEQWCRDGVLPHALPEDPSVALTVRGDPDNEKGFFHSCMDLDADLKHRGQIWIGRELREWGVGPWRRQKSGIRGVKFPPLAKVRELFEAKHGKQDWPGDVKVWESTSYSTDRADKAPKREPDAEIPF
jgi:hypothetical protein